jgi:hypothetical protein
LRVEASEPSAENVLSWIFLSTFGSAQPDLPATLTVRSAPAGPVSAFSAMLYGASAELEQAAGSPARATLVTPTNVAAKTAATANAALRPHLPCCRWRFIVSPFRGEVLLRRTERAKETSRHDDLHLRLDAGDARAGR